MYQWRRLNRNAYLVWFEIANFYISYQFSALPLCNIFYHTSTISSEAVNTNVYIKGETHLQLNCRQRKKKKKKINFFLLNVAGKLEASQASEWKILKSTKKKVQKKKAGLIKKREKRYSVLNLNE